MHCIEKVAHCMIFEQLVLLYGKQVSDSLRILVGFYSLYKCLTTTIPQQRTTFKHLCLFCANITSDSLKPLHLDCISQAAFWIKNDKSQKIDINSSRKCRAKGNSAPPPQLQSIFSIYIGYIFGIDDNIYLIIVPFAIHLRNHFIIYISRFETHNQSQLLVSLLRNQADTINVNVGIWLNRWHTPHKM